MLNEVQHFGDAKVSVQVKVDIVQQVQSCQFTAKLIVFAEFCQQPTVSVIDSEALQSQTIDISESVKLLTGMITSMSDLRENSSFVMDWYLERSAECMFIKWYYNRSSTRTKPDSDWGSFRGRAIYTTKGPPLNLVLFQGHLTVYAQGNNTTLVARKYWPILAQCLCY